MLASQISPDRHRNHEDFEIKPHTLMDMNLITPKGKIESKCSVSNSNYKDGPTQEMLKHQHIIKQKIQQEQAIKNIEK